MSNGTLCSGQLIWCETKVEELEQQLIERKELARNIDNQLRTELAAAQAREKVLRDALEGLYEEGDIWNDGVEKALAQSADDTALKNLLAEGQAREKVLRSHLETLACLGNGCHPGNSTGNQIAIDALATPFDNTALRAALKAERERCAKVCDGYTWADAAASSIRALVD